MDKKKKSRGRKILLSAFAYAAMVVMTTTPAMAADTSAVTQPINNLKTILFAVIAGVGAIYCGWGIFKFAGGLKGHDSSQMNQGILEAVGGGIMAAIGTVVAIIFS